MFITGELYKVITAFEYNFKSLYFLYNLKQFDRDLRAFIEQSISKNENRTLKIYSQVNELQRQVVVKGHYQEYISQFFKQCGF